MYEIFESLLKNAGITIYKFCKILGFQNPQYILGKRKVLNVLQRPQKLYVTILV